MKRSLGSAAWQRFDRLRRQRRIQNGATFALVILGPVLAALTFWILGPMNQGASSPALRVVLLGDLVYVLVVAALVLARVARMVADRRARSAGSRLHLRLTTAFTLLALVPTVLVAIFAGLTLNVGLEGWFSERVRQVVGSSLAAAEAYEGEHRRDLTRDAQALAVFLDGARRTGAAVDDGTLRQILTQGQAQVQRGLREAYVIDGTGDLRARGERSYLFDYERPSADDLEAARAGETVIMADWPNNEFRALVVLAAFPDRFLYVSRDVDGQILSLLDDTRETVRLYNQLEADRGRLLFEFGLLYLGFAVILLLAAIWFGLWFAERLARPVGRLAGAAERVGMGDLDVQVLEESGDDEIAVLGQMFNRMTRQLKGQRDALLENTRQIEVRRRLFDSVLGSVTAGVIGLDADGRVYFVNRAAQRLLDVPPDAVQGARLADVAPEFQKLFDQIVLNAAEFAQEEVRLSRRGRLENLLVRLSERRTDGGQLDGYVVAFDDVTELVSAQRLAAWGDVARRIAHEIKNPLTPIQLSAERIKRKFRGLVGDEAGLLDQYTDVIVRQTGDLRRIVDEFSRFARMPEPERRLTDFAVLVRDAVVLQESALVHLQISSDLPEGPVMVECDPTLMSQALTNLIKNAGEAVETQIERGAPDCYLPEIRLALVVGDDQVTLTICDNGVGLPPDRARLFEPYVTTREKGTGLGLPIVKKIIEEHGGTLSLETAPLFGRTDHPGAMAEIRLPRGTRALRARLKKNEPETEIGPEVAYE